MRIEQKAAAAFLLGWGLGTLWGAFLCFILLTGGFLP